jgi:hypothetical protein
MKDAEIWSFYIERKPVGYDSFMKGKIYNKYTQRVIPTARINLKDGSYLHEYSNFDGYYYIEYFTGSYEMIINDNCYETFTSIIELYSGETVNKNFELTFNCYSFDLNADFTIDVKDVIIAINILSASNTMKLSIDTNDKSQKTVALQSTIFALQYISDL